MLILNFKREPLESVLCEGVEASAEWQLSAEQQENGELQLQCPSNPAKVSHLQTPLQKK